MRKARKALSNLNAPYLTSLKALIETQSKETLVNWCVEYSEKHLLPLYGRHVPADPRPAAALTAARTWMAGKIKLPEAKAAILACHAAARESEGEPAAQAAARAIGQSASSIHSARHCIGLALYGALALAYEELGPETDWALVEAFAAAECLRMEQALRTEAVENEAHPAKIAWK